VHVDVTRTQSYAGNCSFALKDANESFSSTSVVASEMEEQDEVERRERWLETDMLDEILLSWK
jgi:hypothetical protein